MFSQPDVSASCPVRRPLSIESGGRTDTGHRAKTDKRTQSGQKTDIRRTSLPDRIKAIGLMDDVIVMIIAAGITQSMLPEHRRLHYAEEYPNIGKIDAATAVLRKVLGTLYEHATRFVDGLKRRKYRSHTTGDVVRSEALRDRLLNDSMEFVATNAPDPATIDDELRRLSSPEKVRRLLGPIAGD